uniref:UDENN domain-containing protein n=1 Tax=Anolis carolinensis TaxID=28377 RepID=A0A803T1U6_ANOCA
MAASRSAAGSGSGEPRKRKGRRSRLPPPGPAMEPPSGARVPRSPSPPAEPPSRAPPSPSAQPWARLSAWLECACAVTFDLELGSVTSRPLLFLQKTSICYLAFPDSYSGSLGDTQYCFRFRQSGARLREPPWAQSAAYRKEAPAALQQETAHYFGYVYFRQVKDPSVKRGYFQKSLVLVSRLPYVNLFQSLLQLVAPEYFDKLEPCLEAVCSEIDQWPPPVPGQTLNLPVMGVVIQVPGQAFSLLGSPPPQKGSRTSRKGSGLCRTAFAPQVRIPSRVERPDASPGGLSAGAPKNPGWGGGLPPPEARISWLQGQMDGRGPSLAELSPPPPSLSLPPTLPACAAQNPPQIRPFRQEDFLKTLEHAGPQLTCLLKGDWMGLYRRFFRSPNFDGWYRQRRREMTHKLEALHLEAISEANIKAWMEDKSEAEVVDMVLKLREKLARARHHLLPVKEEALQQVGRSAGTLVGSLPEDLQAVLHHQ